MLAASSIPAVVVFAIAVADATPADPSVAASTTSAVPFTLFQLLLLIISMYCHCVLWFCSLASRLPPLHPCRLPRPDPPLWGDHLRRQRRRPRQEQDRGDADGGDAQVEPRNGHSLPLKNEVIFVKMKWFFLVTIFWHANVNNSNCNARLVSWHQLPYPIHSFLSFTYIGTATRFENIPFQGPPRGLPPRRHPCGGRRQEGDGARRLGQGGSGGDRLRHQPGPGRVDQERDKAVRRRRLRRGGAEVREKTSCLTNRI